MLGEKINNRFFFKARLDGAHSCRANAFGQGQGAGQGLAAAVLLNCNQAGKTSPFNIRGPYPVADHARRQHDNINIGRGLNKTVSYIIATGEHQHIVARQPRLGCGRYRVGASPHPGLVER